MDLSEEEFTGIDSFLERKCLIHPVITAQNLYSIYQCPDQQMYRARILFLFDLNQYAFDSQSLDILIDMMHSAILFTSDINFSYPKAIVFLSLYLTMFIEATSSPFYNPQSLHEQYEKLLLSYSVDRPPTSTLIFELRDIRLINEFFVNTFFRHLKLILNCFTPKQILVFKTQFPIRVTYPQLPPLSSMTLIRNENEISREETNSQQSQRTLNTETINEPPKTPQKEVTKENEKEKEKQKEEKSQEIPLQMLMGSFKAMHEKFISDFEEREKQLAGKIKELEMKLNEKQKLKSTQSKKNKL